jgi:hypothetical protein
MLKITNMEAVRNFGLYLANLSLSESVVMETMQRIEH